MNTEPQHPAPAAAETAISPRATATAEIILRYVAHLPTDELSDARLGEHRPTFQRIIQRALNAELTALRARLAEVEAELSSEKSEVLTEMAKCIIVEAQRDEARARLAEVEAERKKERKEFQKEIEKTVEQKNRLFAQRDAAEAQVAAIAPILAEVARATAKFPTWPTDPLHALAVVGEEFGELTKEVVQFTYERDKCKVGELQKEAIQTAAMAILP